jgi:hypothetical protein
MPYLQIRFSCGNELTLDVETVSVENHPIYEPRYNAEDDTMTVGQGAALRGIVAGVRGTAADMIQTALQEWSRTQKSSARASRRRWPQRAGTKNPFNTRFNWR